MISNTLSSGLRQYRIGPKMRSLRLKKKLGLVELGRHTGLSAAMLSKIERELLFPTLPTLLRIAMVYRRASLPGWISQPFLSYLSHPNKKWDNECSSFELCD